jgi:hypothetical protein
MFNMATVFKSALAALRDEGRIAYPALRGPQGAELVEGRMLFAINLRRRNLRRRAKTVPKARVV